MHDVSKITAQHCALLRGDPLYAARSILPKSLNSSSTPYSQPPSVPVDTTSRQCNAKRRGRKLSLSHSLPLSLSLSLHLPYLAFLRCTPPNVVLLAVIGSRILPLHTCLILWKPSYGLLHNHMQTHSAAEGQCIQQKNCR